MVNPSLEQVKVGVGSTGQWFVGRSCSSGTSSSPMEYAGNVGGVCYYVNGMACPCHEGLDLQDQRM